jgi:hypothetical protein
MVKRQGLVREVAAVFSEQTPIDRTNLNSFEDERIVEWAKKTGKKNLVMGGLWTESCLLMSALSGLHAGYVTGPERRLLVRCGTFIPKKAAPTDKV